MPTCQFFDFTAAEVVRRTWKHIQHGGNAYEKATTQHQLFEKTSWKG